MHQVCKLGKKILLEVFANHEVTRSRILEIIFSQVITRSPSSQQFISLLKSITEECPLLISDHIAKVEQFFFNPSSPSPSLSLFLKKKKKKVKEVIDYTPYLPLPTAEMLLEAVAPMVSLNASFSDHLSLVLRKSMFSRFFLKKSSQTSILLAATKALNLLISNKEKLREGKYLFSVLSCS